jgi:hypothetical protein
MAVQSIIVTLLVLGCSARAVWTLMPAAARRLLATAMLRWSLPEPLAARLRASAQPASGCAAGCASCDHAAPKSGSRLSASESQKIIFHPHKPR